MLGQIIGGLLGGLGGLLGGGGQDQRTQTQQQVPQWSPQQLPYLFSGSAWQPQMPMMNPYAVNYASALSGGYNPAFGPQRMRGIGGLLNDIMGGGGQMLAPLVGGALPYYQDPNATPQPGGIAGLLGFGAGAPPPLLMNAAQFGHGVLEPSVLHDQPGRYLPDTNAGPTPGAPQAQAGAPTLAPTAPQYMNRPPPQAFQGPPLPLGATEAERQARMTYLPSQVAAWNQQRDRDLSALAGRNINDLTPEERALLGI